MLSTPMKKSQLEKLYYKNKLSLKKIGKIIGLSYNKTRNLFIKLNIVIRKKGGREFWSKDQENKRLKSWKKTTKNRVWIAWNKGLTKETDERVKQCSETYKRTHKDFSGINNPFHGKKHTKEFRKKQSINKGGTGIPGELTEYGSAWTSELREKIRKRDNYTCQLTGITSEEHILLYGRDLDVHHIDYNKKNCEETNLITLSMESNSRVNYNRDYWKNCFQKKIGLIHDNENK